MSARTYPPFLPGADIDFILGAQCLSAFHPVDSVSHLDLFQYDDGIESEGRSVMRIERTSPERLKPFFLELTRRSFDQLNLGDKEIADYVATMLADFSHSDKWLMLRDAQGARLRSVVEMIVSALGPDGQARVIGERAVRKYVGDYTLFMSGLFRGFVSKRGFLEFYLEEGKRSYEAVSKLDVSLYRPGFLLFEELSRGFETYSGALDYMRKCFFASAPGANPFAGTYRQLEALVRSGFSSN
jgi:hypothetical protein